jgi:hypothetical protein
MTTLVEGLAASSNLASQIAADSPWMSLLRGAGSGVELNREFDIECVSEALQDWEYRHGSAGFEAGDGGLRRVSSVGELGLAPAVTLTELADPYCAPTEVKPELAEPTDELSRVRLVQQRSLLGRKIVVERRTSEVLRW